MAYSVNLPDIPNAFGSNDCRNVKLTADVIAVSSTVIFRLYKPMMKVVAV